MQIGDLLSITDGVVQCTNCQQPLGESTENVKESLPVREGPVTAAGPTFVDTSRFVDEEMVF
ncbi:MAG TPA: hypothetical protein VKA37_01485, partial [Halobacteriales archaeon]|nr:hypothetical protein [Halobacteriales archaeon]